MNTTYDPSLAAARATIYRFLSLAASDPRASRWEELKNPDLQELAAAAAAFLGEEFQSTFLAPGELDPRRLNLAHLLEGIGESREQRVQEYDRVFGLVLSRECPPYETEYCLQTFSVYRSQVLGDVAGYYGAFGLEPSREDPERQDHIALQLEFMVWIINREIDAMEANQQERATICREAQEAFVRDHLAWWVPAFAFALRKKADGLRDEGGIQEPAQSFQGALGVALAAFIACERAELRIDPPKELLAPRPEQADSINDCGACAEGVS